MFCGHLRSIKLIIGIYMKYLNLNGTMRRRVFPDNQDRNNVVERENDIVTGKASFCFVWASRLDFDPLANRAKSLAMGLEGN